MERTVYLIFGVLSTIILTTYGLPVREKISINTDMLRKVREEMNQTTRDPHARNINFAWRVSFTRSTTQPTQPTTAGIKDIEENQVEYQKIFAALTVTLKDESYRKIWTDLIKTKGYAHFMTEIKAGGHKTFMKPNNDNVFAGEEGEKFWKKIVGFLETMGEKGFELLMNSVDKTPLNNPSAPGADKLRPGPGEPGGPPAETPKPAEEPPKEEPKPTEAPK